MDKREQLKELFAEMARTKLPLRGESPLIPGEGNSDAQILFIGEAGGYHEAQLKRPFVGQAGKLLDKLLAQNQLSRSQVWITNVVKARPPQNRDPLPEEIEAYRPFLERELAIIQPRIIATLGRFAMNWFLPEVKISQVHGYVRELPSGQMIFPLYHPAAALRASSMLAAFTADFAKLAQLANELDSPTKLSELPKAHEEEPKVEQPSLFG